MHHDLIMRALALLLPAVVLCACADGGPGMGPGDTGASPPPATDQGETLSGRLGASSVEGGCPYLETDDGTRYEVIYPDGWEVDRQTGAIRNPDGEVVAEAGEVVTIRGERAEMASICQIGPIFRATEVLASEG